LIILILKNRFGYGMLNHFIVRYVLYNLIFDF
jgi:hypothetical protein